MEKGGEISTGSVQISLTTDAGHGQDVNLGEPGSECGALIRAPSIVSIAPVKTKQHRL